MSRARFPADGSTFDTVQTWIVSDVTEFADGDKAGRDLNIRYDNGVAEGFDFYYQADGTTTLIEYPLATDTSADSVEEYDEGEASGSDSDADSGEWSNWDYFNPWKWFQSSSPDVDEVSAPEPKGYEIGKLLQRNRETQGFEELTAKVGAHQPTVEERRKLAAPLAESTAAAVETGLYALPGGTTAEGIELVTNLDTAEASDYTSFFGGSLLGAIGGVLKRFRWSRGADEAGDALKAADEGAGTTKGAGKSSENFLGKVDGAKSAKAPKVVTTGQIHHPISTKVGRALEKHPTLKGHYKPRDPRFTTQAVDDAAHRGYQRWHRDLDKEVVDWLDNNPNATPQQFESYLRGRYSQPDLLERFPNGF